MLHEIRFPAMDSSAHLVLEGDVALLAQGKAFVERLERLWSRFLPDSEISMLNRAAGGPCLVSPETMTLVHCLLEAYRRTHGRFDPFLAGVIDRLGYRGVLNGSDVDPIAVGSDEFEPFVSSSAEFVKQIRIGSRSLVQLPSGCQLDPGGLGKGLAADLAVAYLTRHGASAVLVNLGGDVVVRGMPEGRPWSIGISGVDADPDDDAPSVMTVLLTDGAVATSSKTKRRWHHAGETVHHLVDPRLGTSADVPWSQVSVVARSGWQAEACSKVVFLDGTFADPVDGSSPVSYVVFDESGRVLAEHRSAAVGEIWLTDRERIPA